MKNTIKRPIRRSFITGCVLFILVLCIMLVSVSYSGFRHTLYSKYENYMTNILNYTAAHIDADDLDRCINSGQESAKLRDLSKFLDDLKENMDMEFIYIVVPLNDNDTDNMQSIIAGYSREDRAEGSDRVFDFKSSTGDYYSSETAKKYLEAFRCGKLAFFAGDAKWDNKYTGLLPLRDSSKEPIAALCIDMDIHEIIDELYERLMAIVISTLSIGLVFTIFFLIWSHSAITSPIQDLEQAVTEFASISHLHKSPDELVLNLPPINSGNEIESLANAVDKMSEDIREYATTLTDAEEESRMKSVALGEALEASQSANRAKTTFLSNMSHEIRTPMNAIIGLDNIALNDPEISDTTRDYLEKIGSSAEHLLGLINDILDMSRIESGRVVIRSEEFSLSKALSQVNTIIGGQCREKGLKYDCEILGDLDEYYIGDDMKLRQILINILGNSVKFTPEGGAVCLDVQRIAQFEGNATLRFYMQDTGVGMSKEFIPKLFDSFSQEEPAATNKYGSTGLGMAITKNLVELMNGEIRVESEKGKGTTFIVTVTLKESDRNSNPADELEIDLHELSALVVDNDPIACMHAKLSLSQVGVECETAESGAQAIETVKNRKEPFDMLLIDWSMPEMDGLETTRRIRKLISRDTVIMMLSSYSWDDYVNEGVDAGVDSFISKPLFAASALKEYKQAYLNRQGIAKSSKADLNGRRILVAEDVAINAEIMLMLLQARGMEAEVAENGEKAVEMYTAHHEGYYDAILMDMRMPVMDGLEATGAIRAMNRSDSKTVPIIALTANAFDEDVRRSLQAGLNAHLTKPVEPKSLYETLENLIEP